MVFLSPLWLIALAPWAALAIWLLRGRRPRVRVPFLQLWRGLVPLEVPRRGWRPPPAFVVLAMLALLLALLGAARPIVRLPGAKIGRPVSIVLDRGMTMSAVPGGQMRFRRLADDVSQVLRQHVGGNTEIRLIDIPGGEQQSDAGHWNDFVATLPPTALDTSDGVRAAVRTALPSAAGAVVVISNHASQITDDRLVQVAPQNTIENLAITRLAARETPLPQVMVRVRNDSARSQAFITVTSGAKTITRTVDLPARGSERNEFFDFQQLGDEVEAALEGRDDQPADDRAWLAREGSNPRLEPRTPLSPELRRMVEVYSRRKPATDASRVLPIVPKVADLSDSPGVVLARVGAQELPPGSATVAAHVVTQNVNWQNLPGDVRVASDAPAGWTPLVSVAGKTLVAARAQPARQVWVGFESSAWARTTDFVVFWANVFDWVGQGQSQYVSRPLSEFEPDWKFLNPPVISPTPLAGQWPGLYQTPDGKRVAINATELHASRAATAGDWRQHLAQLLSNRPAGYAAAPVLLLLALVCLLGSALTWEGSRLTPFQAARNFSSGAHT